MKQTANLMMMGFLVVGLWYAVGYLQGMDAKCDKAYEDGKRVGESNGPPKKDD